MSSEVTAKEVNRRRTFAIISHPDAGKTTLTEKLLLFGGAIQMAGTVKGRKATRHATSDWMRLEQERGISITSSVMQFPYDGALINLLDTPGHEDFSEDTYRTLTAVDSALMVIDAAKGVEARTIKLMEVCRLRTTPIISFVNKLDRDGREPVDLLDDIESVLDIKCAPMTWPIGMGREFRGIYHLAEDCAFLYQNRDGSRLPDVRQVHGIGAPELAQAIGVDGVRRLSEELDLVVEPGRAVAEEFATLGAVQPLDYAVRTALAAARGLVHVDLVFEQVVDAGEVAAHADGPGHRRGADLQHALHLIEQVDGRAALAIELVDEGHDGRVAQPADLHELDGSLFDTLGAVDDHERTIYRGQRAVRVFREVLVARRIQQVHDRVPIRKLHDR